MSPSDPNDPFGENERTVIRPNPGGRAPQQPQQPPQQPGYGQPPQQGYGQPQQGYQPQQPMQQQPMQQQPMQRQPTGQVDIVTAPGNNPLIVAASTLLDLLGRLRNAMTMATFTNLKLSVSREIENFEAAASARGAYQQQLRDAKYVLCAAADDIVQNLPGEDRHVWTQDPMLGRYFGERIGGTQFYAILGEQMKNPGANYDLLELMYACLSLGFEGMHRASPTGAAAVQGARRDVHQALRAVKSGGGWMLSPRWKGMDLSRRSVGMQIPFWAVAALAALLLTGAFFGLRFMLSNETNQLTAEINSIHGDGAIEIYGSIAPTATRIEVPDVGPPPAPDPPPVIDTGQLDRIREALAPEIAANLVSADYLDANFIIVRFSNKLLFPSGKAEVTNTFRNELAPRIGRTFFKETEILAAKDLRHGRVVAIGHSDAQRIGAASRWSSNHELSEARARSVMEAVVQHAPPDLRTIVEGRGPDDPVCTPAKDKSCWPRNRRVEFLIERTL